MKSLFVVLALALSSSFALAAKDYQVTGTVLEASPTKIVVQKGKEKWEITRDASTKIKGEPTVGSKVTVYYAMTATEVEAKEGKAEKAEKKK